MISSRQVRRRRTGRWSEEVTQRLRALAVTALVLVLWGSLALGSWWAGLAPVSVNPLAALLSLGFGRHRWPWQSTVVLATIGVLAAAPIATLARHRRGGRVEIDAAARTMQRPAALTVGREKDNAAAAQRLLADAPEAVRAITGPPLGPTVAQGVWLYLPAELGAFIAAGTRTGKTMAWAIPAMLAAWGPVIATSNRPDLFEHTAVPRADHGRRVWLMDLQGVSGRVHCGFWVDLLAQIDTLAAARKLASFWVAASRDRDAKVDSYFDGGAQTLLALYIYAAANAGGDLLHVADWLSRDQDATPALILRRFGKHRAAQRIIDAQALYARQRDGLFDMARRFLDVLSDDIYAKMVTPPSRRIIEAFEDGNQVTVRVRQEPRTHTLDRFDPEKFIASNDTLYALSKAGADSATPLTTALVGQLLEAALRAARQRPGGRLEVPLLAVLDEAANCCRISELPDYYTYAGGHGVILMTFLQVLEQGLELWGPNGLATIRAQSIEVYGGGIGDVEYLQQWVHMADDHEISDRSDSSGPGGTNTTRTWRREAILSVADLAALPKTRALVRLPGHKPVLIRKVPWYESEYAEQVNRSRQYFASPQNPAVPPTSAHTVIDAAPEDYEI